jgi:hypothetical protein
MNYIEIYYYSADDFYNNMNYFNLPNKSNNKYLEEVKTILYSKDRVPIGYMNYLNSIVEKKLYEKYTCNINIKTNNGIITWKDGSNLDANIKILSSDIIIYTKAILVTGLYSLNKKEVYIKILKNNDLYLSRKIEIYY